MKSFYRVKFFGYIGKDLEYKEWSEIIGTYEEVQERIDEVAFDEILYHIEYIEGGNI